MAECRPASGKTLTRRKTSAHEGQGLLTVGVSSGFCSRAPGAQRRLYWRERREVEFPSGCKATLGTKSYTIHFYVMLARLITIRLRLRCFRGQYDLANSQQ
jgi:hypothetical protein